MPDITDTISEKDTKKKNEESLKKPDVQVDIVYNEKTEDDEMAWAETEVVQSFLKEVAEWVNKVSFSKFSKVIKKRVIGQENIDIILADIYNYLENISLNKKINNNALMAAPSGCGKTETYRALKDYFKIHIPDLVIAQVDVSVITEEGITGGGTELITEPLMESDLGGYGIIFMDEFDKKLIPSFAEGSNINAAVQNQLLTIIEGREVAEIFEGNPTGYTIDTSKTMFIGLGSFNESRETKKKQSKNGLGFNSIEEKHDYFEDITREDMIKLGASYEMIGRFPFIINYHSLDHSAVEKIINKTVKEISESFSVKISISSKMKELLHKEANGVYGCRMIDSLIRSITMKKYVSILKDGLDRDECVIKINGIDDAEIA